jgi:hypothetical protein
MAYKITVDNELIPTYDIANGFTFFLPQGGRTVVEYSFAAAEIDPLDQPDTVPVYWRYAGPNFRGILYSLNAKPRLPPEEVVQRGMYTLVFTDDSGMVRYTFGGRRFGDFSTIVTERRPGYYYVANKSDVDAKLALDDLFTHFMGLKPVHGYIPATTPRAGPLFEELRRQATEMQRVSGVEQELQEIRHALSSRPFYETSRRRGM